MNMLRASTRSILPSNFVVLPLLSGTVGFTGWRYITAFSATLGRLHQERMQGAVHLAHEEG